MTCWIWDEIYIYIYVYVNIIKRSRFKKHNFLGIGNKLLRIIFWKKIIKYNKINKGKLIKLLLVKKLENNFLIIVSFCYVRWELDSWG